MLMTSFSNQEYRTAMGQFATGITIVTTKWEGVFYGTTVNAFCSLSLEPPLVMVSLAKASRSHTVLNASGIYGVNILSSDQRNLSERFAGRSGEAKSFEDIAYHTAITGAPLLEAALARLDCRIVGTYEAGDHTLFIGEVYHLSQPAQSEKLAPLIYYGSKYHHSLH